MGASGHLTAPCSLGVTRRTKNGSHFWSSFGLGFGANMGPEIVPTFTENVLKGAIFRISCLEALELFRCLLGAFLGFLRPAWGAGP